MHCSSTVMYKWQFFTWQENPPKKNNLHLHRWHYLETVIFINNNNMRVKTRAVIYGAF